jgi:hypothetical protein
MDLDYVNASASYHAQFMIDPDHPAYPIITDFGDFVALRLCFRISVYHGDIIPEFLLRSKVS